MKKVLVCLFILISCNFAYANTNGYNLVKNKQQINFLPSENIWTIDNLNEESIILTKELIEGSGSYSRYNYPDGSLAFALTTDCEAIVDGKLVLIDNNLLKYSKMVYNGTSFEEILMDEQEVQQIFPNAELFKISDIDNDNKTWLHKPFGKEKTLLLYNNTNKFFHRIYCKSKNVQNPDIKGLITFSKYGFYKFKHYGEYNGQLIFYVR